LKQELSAKYEKKIEAEKAKMKQKILANKEEAESKLQSQLDEMFEKMNQEYEERNSQIYGSIIEKDEIIKSLERKLVQYQHEIDKWKDLYYASQQNNTPQKSLNNVANPLVLEEEEEERDKGKAQEILTKQTASAQVQTEEIFNSGLNYSHDTLPQQTVKIIEKYDVETMTENYEGPEDVTDQELDKYIERTEEKAQALVDTRIETIKFYQKSLIKCLGKLKEYQILIQRFSSDF